MSKFDVKQLREILEYASDNIPVKIYCSYNQYEVKRALLYQGNLIIEVGDTENPIDQHEGPITA